MKKYKDYTILLPSKPFNDKQKIQYFDFKNINFDDETVCALCGNKHDCICYTEYFCVICNKKNIDCECFE